MKTELSKCINIGKDTETKLKLVGIESYEDLKEIGTEKAFLRVQAIDPGACLSFLYGLDGAVEGIKWHQLSPDRKKELQAFLKSTQK
jgi:DNA transformation protein and related proteins